MSTIFPNEDILDQAIKETVHDREELPLFKEYAWDFDKNKFILENGKFKVVEGNEALKVWIWKALKTERYRYLAYSWNYGHELDSLVGKGLSNAALKLEVERYIKEALLINPYLKDIYNLNITIEGAKLDIAFTVSTVYGEMNVSV
ncbi:DUF2634 domain-containing protein [Clostridium thermopalmarium]|uniref:Phage protein XkdS n=1 Tax=Clostridium thermopalmarium DSM 5974 TaxID=1121340 RepID=A0A2T0API7_9CLOT|nr:DUF2634 domain-containing protein [Clostridium thermopalmarium]PRR70928.1 hypothetical protein CPAL_20180 [Clostridium thermopalmarium DSM 5974]PVZ28852.1 uncharacterized protein DUF2634 [Clostridium thermopalmarium DSM 5974]